MHDFVLIFIKDYFFSINKNEPKKSKIFFLHCFFWKTTCRLSVLNASLKPQFLNVKLQLNFSIQQHNKHLSMTETGKCAKKHARHLANSFLYSSNWVFWTQSPTWHSKSKNGTRPLLQRLLSGRNSYSWYTPTLPNLGLLLVNNNASLAMSLLLFPY